MKTFGNRLQDAWLVLIGRPTSDDIARLAPQLDAQKAFMESRATEDLLSELVRDLPRPPAPLRCDGKNYHDWSRWERYTQNYTLWGSKSFMVRQSRDCKICGFSENVKVMDPRDDL